MKWNEWWRSNICICAVRSTVRYVLKYWIHIVLLYDTVCDVCWCKLRSRVRDWITKSESPWDLSYYSYTDVKQIYCTYVDSFVKQTKSKLYNCTFYLISYEWTNYIVFHICTSTVYYTHHTCTQHVCISHVETYIYTS